MRKVVKIDDIVNDVENLENWEVKELFYKLQSKYPNDFCEEEDENVDSFVKEHMDEIMEKLKFLKTDEEILDQIGEYSILQYVKDNFSIKSIIEEYSYSNNDDKVMDEILDYYGGLENVILNIVKSNPERFGEFITNKILEEKKW